MVNILVKLSKYVITLLMAFYTFKCFSVFRHNSDKAKNRIYKEQNTIMYIIHFIAYLIIFIKSENINAIAQTSISPILSNSNNILFSFTTYFS